MAVTKSWPSSGSVNVTTTSYSIPQANNVNWAALTNFLTALADGAQATTFQRFALRVATTSPVTVSTNDCIVGCQLTVPAAVAVTLPGGVEKQVFFISDLTGDAATNNITITPDSGETIGGSATLVLDTDYEAVMIAFQSSTTDWQIIGRWKPNQNVVPGSIALPNGQILIGSASNVAAAQTMSGDITISNAGVTAIGAGVIVNNDVNASAAIDFSKLAALTAGNILLGSALNVVTSTAMSGDITIDSSGVTAISAGVIVNNDINASAAIAVSKLAALTASRAVVTDASGFLTVAATTSTEIGYVNGVTSSIQAQLDAKTSNPMTTTGDIIYASNTATPATAARLGIGAASTVLRVSGGLPSWGLIVNANVDAAAAIAGTKISPDFGSQNVATTGVYSAGPTTITTPGFYNVKSTASILAFYAETTAADGNVTGLSMKNDAREWRVQVRGDTSDDFAILDNTASAFRLRINSSGVVTLGAYTTGIAHFDASGVISSSLIVNADVNAAAAIAGTKISPDFGSQNVATTGVYSGGATTITTPGIFNAKQTASGIVGFYAEATAADADVTGVRMKNDVREWAVMVKGSQSDAFTIRDVTGTSDRLYLSTSGVLTLGGYLAGIAHFNASGVISSSNIVNADVDSAAAIAGTKISPNFGSQNVATTGVYSAGPTTITTPAYYNVKSTASLNGFYVESTGADSNVEGLRMKNDARDWSISVRGDTSDIFAIIDNTAAAFRFAIYNTGAVQILNLSGVGSRAVNADASGFLSAASDSRLKKEVVAEIPGLAEILRIRPRAYKWLKDIENRKDKAAVEIGFFADEVAPIIPSAAPKCQDGYFGFYDRSITAALVRAVQQLEERIHQLENPGV